MMKKAKKFLSFTVAIVFIIAIFMTNVFAIGHSEEFSYPNYDVFNSITGWYDLSPYEFRAQTLASCSSGHTAMVETQIIWEDSVTHDSYFVYEHAHSYVGVYAQSTAYAEIDNPPSSYESDHFYYYDGVMRIEAYLPGPTIYIVN